MSTQNPAVADLVARSNRLGADPTTTNFAGGNTSAKGTETDPVTGEPVELVWVKGSGGDLGTLTPSGLAVLRLDRLRALVDVYPGVEREDEMVEAFDFCLHGKGGAAPSIDTAMHALVDAPHVDHLHPDAGIALATAADGEALTRAAFGDRVAWVPWRRPGFQLALDIARVRAESPRAIGCVLGGHGSRLGGDHEECERTRSRSSARPGLRRRARRRPLRPVAGRVRALPPSERPRPAAASPVLRGWPQRPPQVGPLHDATSSWTSCRRADPGWRALARPARPLPAHQGPAVVVDLRGDAPQTRWAGCASCTPPTARTPRLLRAARRPPDSPPMRGADPRSCWCPASGCSPTARTSRPPAWRASSTSTPSTSCAAPRR
jgi:ribulose-5-phosphate 4-epimerase/fuculose-1-phosphate aldolase